MKKQKMASMLFASVLVLSTLLAGCANNNEGKESEVEQSESPKSGNEGQEQGPRGKMTAMVYDRGNIPTEEGTLEENRWTKWFDENAPADVDWVPIPRNKPEDKLNVLFASGGAPELIQDYNTNNHANWYNSKQLLPLDELIEEHSVEYKALLEKYPILRKLGMMDDGKLYKIGSYGKVEVNWVMVVRKDWLDQLNLTVPTTTDELYEVAKAFTEQDPDQNSKADTFGLSLGGWMNANIFNVMFGMPFAGHDLTEDGKMVKPFEKIEGVTAFKERLYDGGLIDKDFAADSNGEKAKQDFVNGKLGFFTEGFDQIASLYKSLKTNDPDAELIPIAIPDGGYGKFAPPLVMPAQTPAVINANAKDPVAIIKFIDFLNKPETIKTIRWGIEGQHYNLDEQGCPIPTAANETERKYVGDYSMVSTMPEDMLKCDSKLTKLTNGDAVDQELADILVEARKLYINPDVPMPGVFLNSPSLPKEYDLIVQTLSNSVDHNTKAIVEPGYSAADATKDSRKDWEKAGAEDIDQYFTDYYHEKKDTIVTVHDIYPQ